MRYFIGIESTVILLFFSCTSLEQTAVPKPGKTYLFGRFWMKEPSDGKVKLIISRVDKKCGSLIIPLDNTLLFRKNRPVRAYAVEPGEYRITAVQVFMPSSRVKPSAMGGWSPSEFDTADFTDRIYSRAFTVQQQKRYYLGDFCGSSYRSGFDVKWGISTITQNFAVTNDEFERTYPGLKELPVETLFEAKEIHTLIFYSFIFSPPRRSPNFFLNRSYSVKYGRRCYSVLLGNVPNSHSQG
jgi:hypothetical protein